MQNPQANARDQQKSLTDFGLAVHRSTIQRTLHAHGLNGRVARRKPLLRTRHKNDPVNYAREHLNESEDFWNNILWTDETKIELFGHNQPRYAWRKTGAAFEEKNVLSTAKNGGGSIMLWGCATANGPGNLVRVEGRMDSVLYQQNLENNVKKYLKN